MDKIKGTLTKSALFLMALLFSGAGCSGQGKEDKKADMSKLVSSVEEFVFPSTKLMDAAPRAVFVHNMVSFRTPSVSGVWDGWNREIRFKESNALIKEGYLLRNPDHYSKSGRREIGAVDYPAIGPYDMNDPDAVEYQCQLLKMAGLDGINFDVMSYLEDSWRPQCLKQYVEIMHRYGLKGFVCYENKFYSRNYTDIPTIIKLSNADMDAWLKLFDPIAFKINGRPLLMIFEFTAYTPRDFHQWKATYPEKDRPLISHLTWRGEEWAPAFESRFGWSYNEPNYRTDCIPYRRYDSGESLASNYKWEVERAKKLLENQSILFYFGGAWPGFDDTGCWGWGKGPTKVERNKGATYQYIWEQLLKTNLHVAQVATWNDWMEGTTIEPSLEDGVKYLEMTRKYAAQFKKVAEPKGNLMVPIWIYKVRKSSQDGESLKAAQEASEAIMEGSFEKAERVIRPWAEKGGVVDLKPWDSAGAKP